MHISESQAADERLWAGLCNGVFYDYMIQRWDYRNLKIKNPKNDAGAILTRFFFSGGIRGGFYRNTLSKCWWVGHATYRREGINKYELLDAIGSDDFNSKVTEFFYSYTFSSNPTVISGLCKSWRLAKEHIPNINVREYLRPALKYMNALGGSLLLDSLTEEEIKDVFFDYITQLHKKETPAAMVFDDSEDDLQDGESATVDEAIQILRDSNMEDDAVPAVAAKKMTTPSIVIGQKTADEEKNSDLITKLHGKPKEVDYGTTVEVYRASDEKRITYNIPKSKESEWLSIYNFMIKKGIGYTFSCIGKKYEIVDINW